MSQQQNKLALGLTIFVSALGYFVDIYDLLLFGIVRVPSLRAMGVEESAMLNEGLKLLNAQMAGMLLGGILWGIIGDKRGRRNVLFGSILLYSIANIANAFVTDVQTYATLRFFAGLGLAGELGAAITLVSEVMSPKNRGYGTTLVAGTGILGAVLASLIGDLFDWKVAYIVGGGMGICLLGLRAGLLESSMFKNLGQHSEAVPRGAFLKLFTARDTLKKYLCCIFVGMPIWFVIGILVTFGPEFAREFGIHGEVTGSHSIMWNYVGGTFGGLSCGFLSQLLKSRRRAMGIYLGCTLLLCLVFMTALRGSTPDVFYFLCFCFGVATGYWSVFVTNAAEQFGTNMRATAAITVPNFVRGAVVPMTLSFHALRSTHTMVSAAAIVGFVVIVLAFISLWWMQETYGKNLDAVEVL